MASSGCERRSVLASWRPIASWMGGVLTGAAVPPGAQFALVQTLRGFAALWVVLFHAQQGGHIDSLMAALPEVAGRVLFEWGHFGVPVFFALSGFVIAHSLRGIEMTWANLGRFALRRSIRLDPPYWVSILAVIVLGFVSSRVKHEIFEMPSAGNLLAHITYTQVLLGQPAINAVYWTLTYEIQFYLVFALGAALMFAVPSTSRLLWAGMYGLSLASALGWLDVAPTGLFLGLWAGFFAGVVAYHAAFSRILAMGGLILGGAMLASGSSFMLASLLAAVVLYVALASGKIYRSGIGPLGPFLGKISYSLYLVHNPVSGAAGFVGHRIVGHSVVADMVVLAAIVASSVVAATVLWRLVEHPAQRFSKRIAFARNTPDHYSV